MKYLYLLIAVIFISSCQSDDDKGNIDYSEQNEKDIIKYINDNDLDATKSSTGLYYVITTQGEGEKPNSNSNVTVRYKGYFLNKEVFDQSNDDGITFNLQQVITGWTEGIAYFNQGGEGILLIPSRLAYGSNGRSGIPGGSVLIFDIKLLNVAP